MDLNPLFTKSTSFRPAGDGGELKLFEQVGISLVHGWLVDPEGPEGKTLEKFQDYDSAVSLIAEVDHLTHGRFVIDEDSPDPLTPTSPTTNWTESEKTMIEDATVVRRFLDNTKSQLTYHGLFHLATTLAPGSLVALFRSSHLSVLYKSEGDEPALYTLVTDQVFLKEPSVVWERLEDIDGGWSTFVDSEFVRASPAGGDFAGQSAEDTLRASERLQNQYNGVVDPVDQALAQQMQAEEDHLARREHEAYVREQERRQREEANLRPSRERPRKEKKNSGCIIM